MGFAKGLLVGFVIVLLLSLSAHSPAAPPAERSVFALPVATAQNARLQQAIVPLIRDGKYADAERYLKKSRKLFPENPVNHYNLACVQARQGKRDDALTSLTAAVANGFNGVTQLQEDADLTSVRDDPRFSEIIKKARLAEPPQHEQTITPGAIVDGKATVAEANTAWDSRNGVFRTFFARPSRKTTDDKIGGRGPTTELLKEWYAEKTAAGNIGDFYDNHDNDHSKFSTGQFPQVTGIRYSDEAKNAGMHSGLQDRFFFNAVTFGNSSTAVTGNGWRSQTRLAYTQPRGPAILHAQYRANLLYVYPEHRDYDPGHNGKKDADGKKGGYGDVYCANTPYLITSQGSSGSDRPFLDAIARTLAAFQPKTKQLLIQRGALMPTVQMIFRRSNQPVRSDADYLTGKAHPSVFDGTKLDVMKMITLAHEIKQDEVPPLVHLRVVEEDEVVVGKDCFDVADRERLFDTPAAIARIYRTLKQSRRMVVSAVESSDLNDRELTYHWSVLRGNADAITISPLNANGSKVELQIPYHERQPIYPGAPISSNRVDIGVFVHNGKYYSAPGFITFFFLDNEQRVYNTEGQIASVEYSSRANGGNYVDPFIDVPKDWRDEYQYDSDHRLTLWSRHRGDSVEWFTADGNLVTRWDKQRRPLKAARVQYEAKSDGKKPPVLEQKVTGEQIEFQYASDDDHVGSIVSEESGS